MNNCCCNGIFPLILGYIAGNQSCCPDQNIMPLNNNGCGTNNCWWLILLILFCGCGNGCNCNG